MYIIDSILKGSWGDWQIAPLEHSKLRRQKQRGTCSFWNTIPKGSMQRYGICLVLRVVPPSFKVEPLSSRFFGRRRGVEGGREGGAGAVGGHS